MSNFGARKAKLVVTNTYTKDAVTFQGPLDRIIQAACAYLDRVEHRTEQYGKFRPNLLGNAWYDRAIRGRPWDSEYRGTKGNTLMYHVIKFIKV